MSLLTTLAGMEQRVRIFTNPGYTSRPSEVIPLAGHLAAKEEISSWPEFNATPLISLSGFAESCRIARVWYKDEGSRLGLGSFKSLGGAYAVLRILQKEIFRQTGRTPTSKELRNGSLEEMTSKLTVTTATDGNHGRSVAWGACLFHCQSLVYVPKTCSSARELAIARYGGRVVRTDTGYDETVRLCASEASRYGRVVISDTSWPGYADVPREIMQGYTVLVEEVLQQLPVEETLTHVFVQCGVGGLAAAVSGHFCNRLEARSPSVIVVEPEGAGCLFASAQAGRPTAAPTPVGTIMAGLDCGEVSLLAWEVLRDRAAAFIKVPDDVVAPFMRWLAFPPPGGRPIVAGESAVAGLAALVLASQDGFLRDVLGLSDDSRALVIGTEGNTDPELYRSLVGSASQHDPVSDPPQTE